MCNLIHNPVLTFSRVLLTSSAPFIRQTRPIPTTGVLQDVANSMPVDLGEGLQYVDLRRGGGPVVQAGFLTVLQFRYSPCSNTISMVVVNGARGGGSLEICYCAASLVGGLKSANRIDPAEG